MQRENVNGGTVIFQSHPPLGAVQLASIIMVVLSFLAVYAPTLGWLWKRWMMGIWYHAHGALVPFVAAYIIWKRLRAYEGKEPVEGSALGFLFLVPALLMHLVDTMLWSQILSAVSMVPAVIGLSFLLLGRSRTLAIWFPLVLLFFMIPIPSAAIQPILLVLRKLSAVGTEELLRLMGVPLVRTGTVLEFINGSVNIDNPCSGFATLSATLAFTVIAVYIWPIGLFRSLAILSLAPPLALCANILRCTMLSLLVIHFGIEVLHTFLHSLSGYLAYFVAIGLQVGFLELLRRRKG